MVDKEQIIKTCEFWVKHQKGNDLCLAFSAVEELLEVLKEDERLIKQLTKTVQQLLSKIDGAKELIE